MVWLASNVFFSAQKAGKMSLFSETVAGISTLTQWTPCVMYFDLNVNRGGMKEGKVAKTVVRIKCTTNEQNNSRIFCFR